MTYTAEQLREDAHRADGIGTMADGDQLRAHADALEENARLKAAWDASHNQAMKNGAACNEWRDRAERAEAELAAERERADRAKAEGIKEGMRRAAEIAGAKEDQFIALAGEAADNTMRKHYSALASGAGTAAAAILKEAGE